VGSADLSPAAMFGIDSALRPILKSLASLLGSEPFDASLLGRGLHSSTFQLILSHFCLKIHPRHPLMTSDTHSTPPQQLPNASPAPQKALKLSRKVDECKPLLLGPGSWVPLSRSEREATALLTMSRKVFKQDGLNIALE